MTHARGTRLSYDLVEDVLGLILFAVFIAFVIGLAAGVTWLVVRISPMPNSEKKKAPAPPAST
jgi:hypothetical protein